MMRERKTFLISQIIIIYQYLAMSVFLKFIIPQFPPYRVLINPIPNPYKILPIIIIRWPFELLHKNQK